MKWHIDVSKTLKSFVVIETDGDEKPTVEEVREAAVKLSGYDWEHGDIEVECVAAATADDEGYEAA